MFSQLITHARQQNSLLQVKEQVHGSQGRCRVIDATTGEASRLLPEPTERWYGLHLIAGAPIGVAVQRSHVDYFCFCENLCASLFGEVEIVQVESILSAEATSHHASSAA